MCCARFKHNIDRYLFTKNETHVLRQIQIPAFYMRGGTSKGVFFLPDDLPKDPVQRDAILMRVMGSPDPYGQQIDGMGAATSSTSKVVLVSKSSRPDCDVDYRFGQVSINKPVVDWHGNCGNLTSAVGPFAIHRGLVTPPQNGIAVIKIWQANISKKIIAYVPVENGEVIETGDFELDGVTFPSAEIGVEFLDPGSDDDEDSGAALFPTGNSIDILTVPGFGPIEATMINAGNPAIMIDACHLGLTGTELQGDMNSNRELLARCEAIRAHGTVAMGMAKTVEEATEFVQHVPKLAFFAKPAPYKSSGGREVRAGDIDILARIISMGKLHHAMTGTGAVGIAAAAAIPNTVLSKLLDGAKSELRFGHPSGTLRVGAAAEKTASGWAVTKVKMSRSARRMMIGHVLIPDQGTL
jgi:probable AcnD-accessory protein PrpF